jgi:hypothetical protein
MKISRHKLSSFALLCVLFASIASAQSHQSSTQPASPKEGSQSFRPAIVVDSFNKNFEGALDDKIKIRMNLIRQGRDLSGSYLYEKYGKNITLKGVINESGYFEITEYDEKNVENGTFYGAFTSDAAMVGFWTKDSPSNRFLSFHLVESGKQAALTERDKPAAIRCQVKNDNGDATLLMIGGAVVAFEYGNVGANYHTCGLYADRAQKGIVWEDSDATTRITFTKEFFESENTAGIEIKKTASRYDIKFSGDLTYFCGVRALIPPKVSIYKSGNVWVGKAQYQ